MRNNPRGYVIQLYQFAIRYAYNNRQFLSYFNNNIVEELHAEGQSADFLVLGDFDLLEINPVVSFRQYHDVSTFAKKWLGKRQCMLLYDISEDGDEKYSRRLYYNNVHDAESGKKEGWYSDFYAGPDCSGRRFFCLSMFALTNQLSSRCDDLGKLIKSLRRSILDIVDEVNSDTGANIQCEVFGTFNTSELAVVWLGDEYVDILQLIEYVKHLSVRTVVRTGETGCGESEPDIHAFMTTFSVISIQMKLDLEEDYHFRGDALVQISFNDECTEMEAIDVLKREIRNACSLQSVQEHIVDGTSVGEFDWIIRCPAATILKLLNPRNEFKMLLPGERDKDGSGRYIDQECRKILRNNTRLLIGDHENPDLQASLSRLAKEDYLCTACDLLRQEKIDDQSMDHMLEVNRSLYFGEKGIRERLKEKINPSAGIVDTMDLLITDYQSVISTAYSKVWAEDIHVQFNTVLQSLKSLLDNDREDSPVDEFWSLYRDLTNAFKQQVYHLTQSSRLFFEIPTSHLRATGHYDFLMHAYYGIAKKIIETIYLIQNKDSQSDLVPLLTVNTEPQVTSELFFQFEKDTARAMNLIIPNSVLTDPYRGLFYLVHELFHYAVPQDRVDRNYRFGTFMMERIFRTQILAVLRQIAKNGCPGEIEADTGRLVDFGSDHPQYNKLIAGVDEQLLHYIGSENIYGQFEKFMRDPSSHCHCEEDALRNAYENAILGFTGSADSNAVFADVCRFAFSLLERNARGIRDELREERAQKEARDKDEKKLRDLVAGEPQDKGGEKLRDKDEKKQVILEEKTVIWLISRLVYHRNLPEEEFQKRVCLYRYSEEDNLYNHILDQLQLYVSVMEAYSDIAAITLTGFSLIDYIVFFIQNVYDCNRIKSPDSIPVDAEQDLRFCLVLSYCGARGIGTAEPLDYPVLKGEDRQKFAEHYALALLEHGEKAYSKDRLKNLEKLHEDALKWTEVIDEKYLAFQANFGFCIEDIFYPILDNANILQRRDDLLGHGNPSVHKLGVELEKICKLFCDVYHRYDDLRDGLVFSEEKSYGEYMDRLFDVNIQTIQLFQNQKSLYVLNEENKSIVELYRSMDLKKSRQSLTLLADIKENDRLQTEYAVYSWKELQFYIRLCNDSLNRASETLTDDQDTHGQIWYRGETSTDYHLEPTLLRELKRKKRHYGTCENTRERYEFFKTQSDGAPEMSYYGSFSDIDYLALMQHYGIKTNLLDFTDNAFIALYLALKYFSDEELIDDAESARKKQNRDVVLWLFSPDLYNRSRRIILERQLKEQMESEGPDSVLHTRGRELFGLESTDFHGIVPNLSIPHNENLYARYIFGKAWMDERYKDGRDDRVPPLAVWTPRLNHRIRAQSGSFVAFDVYTDAHNYKTLEAVQEDFLARDSSLTPFLYRIVIKKDGCKEIYDALKAMGFTRRFVYPELEQVKYRFEHV